MPPRRKKRGSAGLRYGPRFELFCVVEVPHPREAGQRVRLYYLQEREGDRNVLAVLGVREDGSPAPGAPGSAPASEWLFMTAPGFAKGPPLQFRVETGLFQYLRCGCGWVYADWRMYVG